MKAESGSEPFLHKISESEKRHLFWMLLKSPKMPICIRNLRLAFFSITVSLLVAESVWNQRSLSSFILFGHGIFRINGSISPLGQAVTASIGQCAGFCSRHYKECKGFLMRDSQCSTCGQDNANCQLVTVADGVVIFPGLISSVHSLVNDYQLLYIEASTTVVTGNFIFDFVLNCKYRQ
jgi:hypothetical protein